MMQRYPAKYQDYGTDRASVFARIAIWMVTDTVFDKTSLCVNERGMI